MVTGETEAQLSLHFDFILQKTLLFFVEMATKGYATLKGAVSVTQRKKHSSSQMSIVTPTSIYSIHRPPENRDNVLTLFLCEKAHIVHM